MQNVFYEDDALLRTEANYYTNLLKNNEKETGISQSCIFHEISYFHVTKNLSVDVMHDVLEDICHISANIIWV